MDPYPLSMRPRAEIDDRSQLISVRIFSDRRQRIQLCDQRRKLCLMVPAAPVDLSALAIIVGESSLTDPIDDHCLPDAVLYPAQDVHDSFCTVMRCQKPYRRRIIKFPHWIPQPSHGFLPVTKNLSGTRDHGRQCSLEIYT
jgi:hypothetical protein